MRSFGAPALISSTKTGSRSSITKAGVAATEQYISYVRDGYSPAASVAWNEQEANQELVQGRAAMFIGWWWMASRMINSEVPEVAANASFAPAPGWEGGDTTSYGYLWGSWRARSIG